MLATDNDFRLWTFQKKETKTDQVFGNCCEMADKNDTFLFCFF